MGDSPLHKIERVQILMELTLVHYIKQRGTQANLKTHRLYNLLQPEESFSTENRVRVAHSKPRSRPKQYKGFYEETRLECPSMCATNTVAAAL